MNRMAMSMAMKQPIFRDKKKACNLLTVLPNDNETCYSNSNKGIKYILNLLILKFLN